MTRTYFLSSIVEGSRCTRRGRNMQRDEILVRNNFIFAVYHFARQCKFNTIHSTQRNKSRCPFCPENITTAHYWIALTLYPWSISGPKHEKYTSFHSISSNFNEVLFMNWNSFAKTILKRAYEKKNKFSFFCKL